MRILGLTGYKQSGKSTLAGVAREGFNFKQTGFATPLKELIWNLWPEFSYDHLYGGLKEEVLMVYGKSFREIAQVVGTDMFRNYDPDVWVRATRTAIDLYKFQMGKAARDLVLDDIRFDNEAALIRELGGQVWEVVRPGQVQEDGHASEQGLLASSVDMVILNAFGLDEYIAMCNRKVKEFVDGQ